MEQSVTIEIDDIASEIELCGENCKFLENGYCVLFEKQLEKYSQRKIEDFDGKNLVYDETPAFDTWKRYEQCICTRGLLPY